MTCAMLVKRIGIALLAIACVASCGARTDTTPTSVRLADFPALGALAFCSDIAHCCTDGGQSFDQASCVTKVQAGLVAELTPAPDAPATPDTAIPQRCVDTVASAAAQCRTWSVCAEVLEAVQKHAAEGEPCAGTCTRVAGTLACGREGTTDPNASPCFASDGLFCSSTSATCVRRAAIGQPCSESLGCESSHCDSTTMTCAASLSEGSDCGRDVLGCGDGLVCETQTSIVCTSISTQAGGLCACARTRADGEACTDGRQCASMPCNDGQCQGANIRASGLQVCGG
jgi:hypothetical protein